MAITDNPALMRLLTKIYDEKGLDFTQYKEASLLRRIHTRLNKYNIESYDEYIKLLQDNPAEYKELINALSINVTEFFRNPESFEAIEKIVIPHVLVAKRGLKHRIIRAWSCGCSSGDEPYSLSMLLLERLGHARQDFLLTIIGTDIDEEALIEAKNMVYSRDRLKAVDKYLLDKYFESIGEDKYRLNSRVRGMVKFRKLDVVKDIPYRHCDIILCRNLLIYFNKQLQEEVLLKFYDCLNPGGFLILGMAESLVGAAVNAFEHVNSRLRIYRKPEDKSLQYEGSAILSQSEIDGIVAHMLDKE